MVFGEAAGNRYACHRETAPRGKGSLLRPFAEPLCIRPCATDKKEPALPPVPFLSVMRS